MNEFEGDLLLIDTPDGGDLVIETGILQPDRRFDTAVYISLFGGNKEDSGKVKTNKTWWGNTLEDNETNKIVSRFQFIITAMPLTIKNIKAAEAAAKMDLQWIIDQGIADKIEAEGRTAENNFFTLAIKILKDNTTLFENSYSDLWVGRSRRDYGV